MKIIAGLGNPGKDYSHTRHNIGFMVIEKFMQKYDISLKKESKFNSYTGKGIISNTNILLVEPLTFMNLSGTALAKISHWYKIPVEDILVIFDDINLDFGRVRFRDSGSDGGHNGIKSIIQCFGGANNFARLKVGVGPDPGGAARKNYVLQNFAKKEIEVLPKILDVCVNSLEVFLSEDISAASNKFNGLNILE